MTLIRPGVLLTHKGQRTVGLETDKTCIAIGQSTGNPPMITAPYSKLEFHMPDLSANLSLPYLLPSQAQAQAQAQKHVTHNEALRQLDTLVQMAVQSFNASEAPPAPEDGEIHALGLAPTGVWAGQGGQLAVYNTNAWTFLAPKDGWRAWDMQASELKVYSAGVWLPIMPELQNLEGVGVGTTSDATNRLAVASDAALLTHAGSDHRLTINKAGPTDTASMVFQSNWSGRAEIGLTGDEDFHFRVSSDGAVTAPCLMSGSIDIAGDSVGYVPTPSAGGMFAINLVDPLYPQAPHSGLFSFDTGPSMLLHTLAAGSRMDNLNTDTLTGTSGTDEYTSLAVRAGELQIENRYGSLRRYAYTFLNTY